MNHIHGRARASLSGGTALKRGILLFSTVFGPGCAWAQTVATPEEPAPAEAAEIIVTGQRRSERLQDVPASITALSSEDVAASGFQNPRDLQYVAPSVSFSPATGAGFQIRGVGSQGVDYNLEKAVATVVDEVVQGIPRNLGINTLSDIERIEVLRGPQGTLFGKNASGGVIFVVSRKPVLDDFELIGQYRYGTDDEMLIENTVNLPVSKDIAFRATGVYQRRDGVLRNRFDGSRGMGYRDYQLKGKLLWQVTPDFEAYLIADIQNHRDKGLGNIETLNRAGTFTGASGTQDIGAILAQYGIVAGPRNEDYAIDAKIEMHIRSQGIQANLTYDIGDYSITSITAYKHQNSGNESDLDNTPTNFSSLNLNTLRADQFSQELRLNSPTGGFIDYVVGAYFYDLDVRATERQGGTLGRTLPPNTYLSPVGAAAHYVAKSRSVAAFGQANLHFTDTLTGIVGGRYTRDRVFGSFRTSPDPEFNLIPQTILFPDGAASAKGRDFSGRLSVQYQPMRDLMFYATASQGYKAPAIGTIRGVVRRVASETVTNYEVGIKSQFFDRVLTLNVSAFTQKFKNFQTQTLTNNSDGSITLVLANAGGLRSRGIEADARLRLSDALSLTGGLAYNPTKYTDYLTSCYPLQPLLPAPGRGCYIIPGTTTRAFQAAGQPLILAPKTTINAGLNFDQDITGDLALFVNTIYSWRSKAYSVAGNPNSIVDGYGLFNGNIGVGPRDDSWRLGIYFRNLFDEFYVSRLRPASFAPPGTYTQSPAIDARRTVGAKLEFRF